MAEESDAEQGAVEGKERSGKNAADLKRIIDENEILRKRLEQDELARKEESNSIGNEEIVLLLAEVRQRLETLETRQIPMRERNEGEHFEREPEPLFVNATAREPTIPDGNNVVHARLPKGGWLKSPFEDLKYFGKTDTQNPIKFLRRFEKIATYENISEAEKLYFFGKCMRGTASSWYDVREPDNITEGKQKFIEYFWGDEQQARFRESIYTGNFSESASQSMSEYALNIAKQAKYLNPPMSEMEIIRSVKRHFSKDIAREIRPTTVKNVEEFVKLLDELDYERMRAKKSKTRDETQKTPAKERATTTKPTNVSDNVKSLASKRRDASDGTLYEKRNATWKNQRQPNVREKGQSSAWNYNKARAIKAEKPEVVELSESETEDATGREIVPYDKKFAKKSKREYALNEKTKPSAEKKSSSTKGASERRKVAAMKPIDKKLDEESDREFADDNAEDKHLAILRTREILNDVSEASDKDQSANRGKPAPYVQVVLRNIRVTALVDTGAQISAITMDLFDRLNSDAIPLRIIPIRKFLLRGAFNDKGQPIANRVQLEFKIKDREFIHEFYVVKNLSYQMILGIDFLIEQAAILECGEKNVAVRFNNAKSTDATASVTSINVIDANEAEKLLTATLNKFSDIFKDEIGQVTHYTHKIAMKTERPFKTKLYSIPDIHRDKVREHILEMESQGIIERAATQYINPLVVVVKKSGDIRLCLDAREINKKMCNDHDQPPTIDEVFRRIGSRRYFSTLDIAKAFWQIPLDDESKKYVGFMFDNQLYVFRRMPFGLKTAGASFTRAIRKALGDECDAFTIVYLGPVSPI
ncbi:uncharacterized protein LOC118644959 [Monomorium pharaonis]|uniref:uncharacterized protein LOC118644959 n=1 Tax=Monomorium pharaonis TaxID=307658 RepID=UPI0017468295|nr:uncharacterized protein LOC118644959 [Monomorium pharaonis]